MLSQACLPPSTTRSHPGGPLQGTQRFVPQGQSRKAALAPRQLASLSALPGHFTHSEPILEAAAHPILFNALPGSTDVHQGKNVP